MIMALIGSMSVKGVASILGGAGAIAGTLFGIKKAQDAPDKIGEGGLLMKVPPNHVGYRLRWNKVVHRRGELKPALRRWWFFPLRLVRWSYSQGAPKAFDNGTRLQWPVRNTYVKIFVQDEVQTYRNQSVWTKDQLCFYITARIRFIIEHPDKTIFHAADYRSQVETECQVAVSEVIESMTSSEISHAEVSKRVKRRVGRKLKRLVGVKVLEYNIVSRDASANTDEAMAVTARAAKATEAAKDARSAFGDDATPGLIAAIVGRAQPVVSLTSRDHQFGRGIAGVVPIKGDEHGRTIQTTGAVAHVGGEGGYRPPS